MIDDPVGYFDGNNWLLFAERFMEVLRHEIGIAMRPSCCHGVTLIQVS